LKTLDGHRLGVLSLSISKEGRFLATGCKGGILQFWSLPEGRRLAKFEPHQGGVVSLALTSDGLLLASGGHDGFICLWDTVGLNLLHKFKAHSGAVVSLKVTPDNTFLVSASSDGKIGIWRLPSAAKVTVLDIGSPVNAITFGPEAKLLLSGSQDKRIRVWHLNFLKPLALATHKDLEKVMSLLRQGNLPDTERVYWEFLEVLLQGKFRYDIFLEKQVVTFEPYDIEIDTTPEEGV